MNSLTNGEIGEILIGGDGVSWGYLNREELTAEKFIDNPFSNIPGDKIYRTGDLGKLKPDGEVVCLGRIDHQVKVRGYRIELGEIEFHLGKQDDIKEAVVIAREDTPGYPRLVAYLLLKSGETGIRLPSSRMPGKMPCLPNCPSIWCPMILCCWPYHTIDP
jgi:acyl-CoA synthetase (AMP-forming)/AMP-acid ligase II